MWKWLILANEIMAEVQKAKADGVVTLDELLDIAQLVSRHAGMGGAVVLDLRKGRN